MMAVGVGLLTLLPQGGGGHITQLKPVLSEDEDIVSLFPAFLDKAIS